VARGGGALEDLWAFNDEAVARAIAASPVPVVSGVGHETDFTIADFAADLRAPTPSAAAELVSPVSVEDLQSGLQQLEARRREALGSLTCEKRWALAERQAQLKGLSPQAQLRGARQRLDDMAARAAAGLAPRLALERERWNGLRQALYSVSPLAVLQRGYAVVSRADGSVVRRAAEVRAGEALQVRVSDGEFEAQVRPPASGGNEPGIEETP
jgi:exodeoxyribonuclease VII large subunit